MLTYYYNILLFVESHYYMAKIDEINLKNVKPILALVVAFYKKEL